MSERANIRVGLTGGMGSGKSSVARRLAARGALVVDADVIAREVVAPGTSGLMQLVDRFGAGILQSDGSLDRAALGSLAFADDASRHELEAITHPLIAARTAELMATAKPGQVIVHDIPLLVELQRQDDYDLVVVVDAPLEKRLDRLMQHRGIARDVAMNRIKAQADEQRRRAIADVWIDNDGSEAALDEAVDSLWQRYLT